MKKNYIVIYIDQHGVTRESFFFEPNYEEMMGWLHNWEKWGQTIVEIKEV